MTGFEIALERTRIEDELTVALATYEYKDDIRKLRKELKKLQKVCPHKDETHPLEFKDGICPYCGANLEN